MAAHGHVPLPPYVTHADTAEDESRYQTVFAKNPGSVAAPTAALHFDDALLAAIDARGARRWRFKRIALRPFKRTLLPTSQAGC